MNILARTKDQRREKGKQKVFKHLFNTEPGDHRMA